MNSHSKKILIFIIVLVFLQSGCSFVRVLNGEPAKDISSVRPGVSKKDAEVILGTPQRDWITSSNIRYCIYIYNGGVPTSLSNVAGVAFFELLTFVFLFELTQAIGHPSITDMAMEDERIYDKVAVSYNNQNKIIDVFDHFHDLDYLPPNGVK